MAGYTRQSLAAIQDGEDIVAAPLNAEFDQLQDAFNAITGHTHDGTIGNGPKLALGGAVSGTLPVTNGGTGLNTVAIDQILYTSALNTLSPTPITAFGRSLLDDVDALAGRITLDTINATNLTTGTVDNARLPTTMSGKIFTSSVSINPATGNTNLFFQEGGVNRGVIYNDDTNDRFVFRKYSATGVTEADLSIYSPGGVTDLKYRGNTVWTAENDGAGTGMDSDLLDGQHGSFYQNATNINAGTLNEARLPTTINGNKTFTGNLIISSTAPIVEYNETDAAKSWFTVADGGTFTIRETNLGTTRFTMSAGGSSQFNQNLTALGAITGASINTVGTVISTGGDLTTQSVGNRHVWFKNNLGVARGLVYSDSSGDPGMIILNYNSSGVNQHGLSMRDSGFMDWTGSITIRGTKLGYGNVEDRTYVDADTFFRWIYVNNNTVFFQRDTVSSFATAQTLMSFDNGNNMSVNQSIVCSTIQTTNDGAGTNVKIGNDVWIGDINQADTMSIRGQSSANNGFIRFGNDTNALGSAGIIGRLYYGSTFFIQTDGNMFLPAFGDYLYSVIGAKAGFYSGSVQDATALEIGHIVLVTTADGAVYVRNSAVAIGLSSTYAYTPGGSPGLAGTWRARGGFDPAGSGAWVYVFQRTA